MTARRSPRRLATTPITSRPRTESEGRAQRREGHYSKIGQREDVWREPPVNGRPIRWYVYRGKGPFADEELVMNADVARLEAERLKPYPKEQPDPEQLIRELVHVLACALGVGRKL